MLQIGEGLFFIFITLMFITQFAIPLVTGKPFFGLFRKDLKVEPKLKVETDLGEKMKDAKEKVKTVKGIQNVFDEHFRKAKDLKNESDNLLK